MKKMIGYATILMVGLPSSAVAFDTPQLTALKNSDIAGTCWTNTFSRGIVQHKFNSNGTFERTQFNNNPASVIMWTGNWRISSNEILQKVKDVTFQGRTSSSNDGWKQAFVVRNRQLINSSGYVYTLGCN
jgi:opacity protein-like surface antigen